VSDVLALEGITVEVKPHFWTAQRPILRDVSLTVAGGEIFGFLGPNGAGKTTTIKTILGLVRPSRGSVRIFGERGATASVRARLGFMPEHADYPPHLTARELVIHHALLAGLALREARRRAAEALDRVGLADAADRRLRVFSKGMLQRAGFAQALVGDPDLVILDEPMSGLDPIGRRDLRTIMQELRAAGKTVFFSTHILPDVETLCDRVAILAGGRVLRVGDLEHLLGTAEATDAVEITADGCSAEAVGALGDLAVRVVRHGDAVTATARGPDDANRIIDVLRARGARVRSVHSHRRSLEDVFVSELGGGGSGA